MQKTYREHSATGQLPIQKTELQPRMRREEPCLRVLLAARSELYGSSVCELLGAAHHNVVLVRSAEDAIAPIYDGNVDVLLLDASGLADPSPIEFCRILKRSPATQFLPTFILSEENDIDVEAAAIEAGADAFLAFPIQPKILRAHIASSLRRKALVEKLDDSDGVLYSLAMSVEERDGTLGKHCERLAAMASSMGMLLGLPASDIVLLQRAGYLHDIGKVAVPDSILFKTGSLTPDEWCIMERHTERGAHICGQMRSLEGVLPIIRHHHEKWDGSGYPDRLCGEEIPLLARIVQLADIYDALTTERSYKRAMSPDEAIRVIREETAKGWRDPKLTEQFVDLLPALSEAVVPDSSQLSLRALAGKLKNSV